MKRGSALLVVLGMMAFIVVSAVAFSAYMRYARMPSSYLRRTSSSRMLVKAALAEAINAVDLAIGNDPYPGVGGNTRNRWQNRVFMPSGASVGTSETVSTLTLEGLAYIPPAFINEVRYLSRRTSTAEWQTLNYDAGRYAYCAIDVSDCLDVNRILADVGRNSSDEGRITLSYCLENPSHSGYTVQPTKWETFMAKYSDASGRGSKIPLVSVADLNLAMKANGGLDDMTPFCKYLEQSNNAKMVTDDSAGSEVAELQRSLAFVTDSCFPATNMTSTSVIDLSRPKDQPFYGLRMMKSETLTKNADTFDQLVDGANAKFRNEMSVPEMVQLYDYLDRDSVPLSLALPTVERTPMITGVAFNGGVSVIVDAAKDKQGVGEPDSNGLYPEYVEVDAGALRLAGEVGVKAGFVYPFKYNRGKTPSFRAQAAATVLLMRSGDENVLRRAGAAWPAYFAIGNWANSKKGAEATRFNSEEIPVVVTMQSDIKRISIGDIEEEEDAVCTDLTFNLGNFNVSLVSQMPDDALMDGATFDDKFKKTTFRKIVKTDKGGQKLGEKALHTSLKLPNANLSNVVAPSSGEKYVPVVQVWVRILDENDKVVDLVPAYCADDETASARLRDIRCAATPAFVRFYSQTAGGIELTYDDTIFSYGTKEMSSESGDNPTYPKAYMADDPRFNHAPENLMVCTEFGGNFKTEWFEKQTSKQYDGDIFMTTSDAGYLQSVFELSALNDMPLSAVNGGAYNGTAGTLPAKNSMWRTYSQAKIGPYDAEKITSVLPVVDSGRGFRVNPYTSDVNVMMAALANTPVDWWAASTNEFDQVKLKMLDNLEEANKYTFSKHAEEPKGVKVEYGKRGNTAGTLLELAQKFQDVFRANTDWKKAFDEKIVWDEENQIAGVDLGVTLHSVDKKYLHGFWRECFANRQHLFLVFVRAEPMMMGGGGMGQTPPQLGARAVALVWRDPTANTKYPGGPHRTRVLFYRQFD